MHVLPKWRNKKIADIRRADVRELIDGIEGDVLPNRVLTLIKTIFRYALSRDWIDASPIEGIAKLSATPEPFAFALAVEFQEQRISPLVAECN